MGAGNDTIARGKEVLTTGEVARICHVAPRTVSKWFDTGRLRGYRIPGSRDRRIPLRRLLEFMRAHGLPMEGLDGAAVRVLIVGGSACDIAQLAEGLAATDRYEVRAAANDFEAGVQAGRGQPQVVLVDTVSEDIDAREILANLRANPLLSETRVVAVAGRLTTAQTHALIRQGYDAVLTRPCTLADLIAAIEEPARATL